MKHLSLIISLLFILSCGSSKQALQGNTKTVDSKPETSIAQPKTPETPKTPTKPEMPVSTEETPEVMDATTATPEVFSHTSWDLLLKKHVSNEGNVDYKGFKKDRKQLTQYITDLSSNLPADDWKKEDVLAYWINAYNALTIDLILRNYPLNSIKDIKDPWDQRLWKFGTKWYNLNQIEHQILRKMDEPRIHFAIVCASFSCPKLQNQAFTANTLDAQLTTATETFLADNKRNFISTSKLELSKIFKWFAKDFKQNGSLIDFLNAYTEVTILPNAKKSFKDYNWDLND